MPLPDDVFFQGIAYASVKTIKSEPRLINLIEGEDWSAPIMVFLHHYYKPDSTTKHIKMQQRAKTYQIVANKLYKTSISDPFL
jgi:hypothetical protein